MLVMLVVAPVVEVLVYEVCVSWLSGVCVIVVVGGVVVVRGCGVGGCVGNISGVVTVVVVGGFMLWITCNGEIIWNLLFSTLCDSEYIQSH